MNKILLYLNKPYPLEERKSAQIKLALIFGFVVFMLMYFVKPFGFSGSSKQLLVNSLYAGALTSLAIAFDFFILFPLFPQFFKEEKWTIAREIIFTLIIITTIATFNVLAGKLFWDDTLTFASWLKMIFFTGVVGIAPATISILINQTRLLKKYRNEVVSINEHLPHKEFNEAVIDKVLENFEPLHADKDAIKIQTELAPQPIIITSENEKENLSLSPQDFLAATSADNYVKIFYTQNNQLKTTIIRSTLKKLEETSASFATLFRCHRTAIVNLVQVEKVNGTAQGYKLKLAFMVDEIPVSRNLNKELKERLGCLSLPSKSGQAAPPLYGMKRHDEKID